jgi:uncharacterized membrane protein YeaQ/YmgE (transglycosylase-associated protein family)
VAPGVVGAIVGGFIASAFEMSGLTPQYLEHHRRGDRAVVVLWVYHMVASKSLIRG